MKPNFIIYDDNYVIKELKNIYNKYSLTADINEVLVTNALEIKSDDIIKVFEILNNYEDAKRKFNVGIIIKNKLNQSDKSFPSLSAKGIFKSHQFNFLTYYLIKFLQQKDNFQKIYKSEINKSDFNIVDEKVWEKKFRTFFLKYMIFKNRISSGKEIERFFVNQDKFIKEYSYDIMSSKDDRFSMNWYYFKNQYEPLSSFYLRLTKSLLEHNSSTRHYNTTKEKGTSFEEECKNILLEKGWKVDTTPSSNDQGADLIATRGLLKLIAQCKNYDGAVGNDAVQQVISAKAFYKGTVAVVVSNSDYTNSAKLLAEKTEVLLLKKDDLRDI